MVKQAIFKFGFITFAVFVRIKGNSFQATFTKLNNGSLSDAENVSHSELFANVEKKKMAQTLLVILLIKST